MTSLNDASDVGYLWVFHTGPGNNILLRTMRSFLAFLLTYHHHLLILHYLGQTGHHRDN